MHFQILSGSDRFANLLGVDINDPRITFPGAVFEIQGSPTFEDAAGNPLHFYLILSAIAIFAAHNNLRKQPYLIEYLITLVGAFILFCLLLKWQPWHSRLHITLFVLFSAFVGVVFAKLSIPRIGIYTATILLVVSLFWGFYNDSRPIATKDNIFNQTRIDQYFNIRGDLRGDYKEAVNFINNQKCSKIGLSFLADTWEYPFWVLFQTERYPTPRLEHTNIKNLSAIKLNQYPYNNFTPCAIISRRLGREQKMVTKNGVYLSKWSGLNGRDPVNVLMRKN